MKKQLQFKTRLKWSLFLLLGVIGMGANGQTLIGEEIVGFGHLGLGETTSISADGNTVAIGLWSPNWYDPISQSHAHLAAQGVYGNNGSVRVYTKTVSGHGVTWEQVGDFIFPETLWERHYYGQRSGRAISLSDDGSVIAIGARGNEGNGAGTDAGHVRIFQKVADTPSPGGYKWVQVGNDIDGTQAWGLSGFDVSLSGDGNVVVIGAPFFDVDDLPNAGQVRVYRRGGDAGDNWIQIGSDIEGQSDHERLGISLSMSDDGNTLAMTALNLGAGYRDEYNRLVWDSEGVITKVFKNVNNNWSLIGEFIGDKGIVTRDDRGAYVRLTGDGNTLAITSVIDQSVQVYERDSDDNWTLKGNELKGSFGYALSISDDAKTLAIGTPLRDFDRFLNVGAVRIYKYRPDNTWQVVGGFNGEHRGHELGNSNSVSLSEDGSVVAIGASDYGFDNSSGYNLLWGRARMFNIGISGVYIEGAPETINTTDPFEVTFKLDRAVSGFNEEDIKVTNATVSDFKVIGESKYSATITPVSICEDDDDISINVAAGAAFDIDSNMSSLVAQEVVVKTGIVALAQDITAQLDPNGIVTISPEDVDNGSAHNCQDGDAVILSLDRDFFTCSDIGTPVTVTLTATSGNQTDTTTAIVTVENNVNGPVAVTKDITVQLNDDGIATISPGDIDNGSGAGCENSSTPILLSLDKNTFTCDDVGQVTVTLTVAQGNNSHSATAKVTVEATEDCEAEAEEPPTPTVTVNPSDFTKGFSPNGDGIGDNLVIQGLEDYGNNEVRIYDLNQRLIYRAHYGGPGNAWDGTYKGKMVPVGAYVCIIDYNEKGKGHESKMIYVNY